MKHGKFEIRQRGNMTSPFTHELVLHHNSQYSSAWQLLPEDLVDLSVLLTAMQDDIRLAAKRHSDYSQS